MKHLSINTQKYKLISQMSVGKPQIKRIKYSKKVHMLLCFSVQSMEGVKAERRWCQKSFLYFKPNEFINCAEIFTVLMLINIIILITFY